MEKDKKSDDGVLGKLALITDAIQTVFPDGKSICVFELNDNDFKSVLSNFRQIDQEHKKFSIDISGVEHVFIHESENNKPVVVEELKIEKPKPNLIKKILSRFKGS
jgi:hypothetical protein